MQHRVTNKRVRKDEGAEGQGRVVTAMMMMVVVRVDDASGAGAAYHIRQPNKRVASQARDIPAPVESLSHLLNHSLTLPRSAALPHVV